MTLIKSISGIRGTIGGKAGQNLTPEDIIRFTAAFGTWIKRTTGNSVIVIGRDARISGEMVNHLVTGTLQSIGMKVVDLGLSTTPTVEIAVPRENAGGGIIITASHNPKNYNALKLLNHLGEFISGEDGKEVLRIADEEEIVYADVDHIGEYQHKFYYIQKHIDKIMDLDMVDRKAIKERNFKVVIDCVNSTGGISVPELLVALGVTDVVELFTNPNGRFPHNPEPLPEHLSTIAHEVKHQKADLGLVVDPDVDRLAIVCEDGEMFGEEYSLVAIADYVLQHKKGDVVSNLSSTQALRDVAKKYQVVHHQSAVGEVHVVRKMKEVHAVIGGEGNGGIILPELHYGRDALVGIALFLSHLARSGKSCSRLRAEYPNYFMAKNKIELPEGTNVQAILAGMEEKYKKEKLNKEDGLKIEMDGDWVHLRASNTEPIIRIYSESSTKTTAENINRKMMDDIRMLMK
ncbi:MAG TPA: phosphoglucosamine mutase [Chitinophagales bacterium]|nr:phosphoglucosamine mutase [Chitinophagales bacterium]